VGPVYDYTNIREEVDKVSCAPLGRVVSHVPQGFTVDEPIEALCTLPNITWSDL
jgi:hypothetical protein